MTAVNGRTAESETIKQFQGYAVLQFWAVKNKPESKFGCPIVKWSMSSGTELNDLLRGLVIEPLGRYRSWFRIDHERPGRLTLNYKLKESRRVSMRSDHTRPPFHYIICQIRGDRLSIAPRGIGTFYTDDKCYDLTNPNVEIPICAIVEEFRDKILQMAQERDEECWKCREYGRPGYVPFMVGQKPTEVCAACDGKGHSPKYY